MTTTNLADFGHRERQMAEELLSAWNNNGLPDEFDNDGVVIMMNQMSGNVFLTNNDCQVAMLNDENELELWHNLPYCGEEGFLSELLERFYDFNKDDQEYLEQYADWIPVFELTDGTVIEEGEEYFVIDDNEVVETVYDSNSDRDIEGYKTEIEAYEALAEEHDLPFRNSDKYEDKKYEVISVDEETDEEFPVYLDEEGFKEWVTDTLNEML